MTLNISSGRPWAATGPAPAHRTWAPLAVMLTGTFMIVLDFFIVNVAIPSIQHGLHAGPAGIEWVVTAYGLTYGVGLITGGRLGDRYGRRRMFITGLALFTLASLACGLAGNAAVLVISRAIQGIGAALAGPQTLALIGVTYEGRRRVTAVTAYGVTLGLAAVLGQLFGGLLIRANVLGLDWRSCFLVNLPVGVVMAAGYAILGVMVTSGGVGHVPALTVPLLVIGVGMGMLTAPLTGIVLSQVMPQHVGTVSGLQATTVQLGNSVGVAVIGVVFFGGLAGGFAHAFGAALAVLATLPLAAAVAIQFLPRRRG